MWFGEIWQWCSFLFVAFVRNDLQFGASLLYWFLSLLVTGNRAAEETFCETASRLLPLTSQSEPLATSLSWKKVFFLLWATFSAFMLCWSLAENHKISDLHILGFRSFDILLLNSAFLDFLLIDALLSRNFLLAIDALFPQIFWD